MRVFVIAFSDKGERTAKRIADALVEDWRSAEAHRCADGELKRWTKAHFSADALVFVGACGIAVRAIAPFVYSKMSDPAVIVVDEGGGQVIPILSGHVGGANTLAEEIAKRIKAKPVLTTATDIGGVFAFDAWAARRGMGIARPEEIKRVSVRMLAGETVRLRSEFALEGRLPEGVVTGGEKADVLISRRAGAGEGVLKLVPRTVTLGMGARKGVDADDVAYAVDRALAKADCHPLAVKCVCSIDLKAREKGILDFCRCQKLPFWTFSARELAAVKGTFSTSAFVLKATGVDNVCERSAMLGSGTGAALLLKKSTYGGVTIAMAAGPYTVCFEEGSNG